MSKRPSLSIVVPTFRRPAMLKQNLAALIPQADAAGAGIVVIDNDPDGSARETVEMIGAGCVRYVHEQRKGLARARNRGVSESAGDYILFIDDDEIPAPDWVAAHQRLAEQGVDMAFGKVVPLYWEPVPAGLGGLLDQLYTRDLQRPTGTDVTASWAHVGTGNSMFARHILPSAEPFDTRFNASGGEDTALIKALIAAGARLTWNPDAVVHEQIAPDRASLEYLQARKYRHGQQRVTFVRGRGGLGGNARALMWMGVGFVQLAGHGAHFALRKATGSERQAESAVRLHAGLGKLLWWRGSSHYG